MGVAAQLQKLANRDCQPVNINIIEYKSLMWNAKVKRIRQQFIMDQ